MNRINWKGVLGYENGNTVNTLRSKYKRQSLRVHPNRPGGSTEAMQELGRAWEKAQEHFGRNWRRAAETPEPAAPPRPPPPPPRPRVYRRQKHMTLWGKMHSPNANSRTVLCHLTIRDNMMYDTVYKNIARKYPSARYITSTFEGQPTAEHVKKRVDLNNFERRPEMFHLWSVWTNEPSIVYSVQAEKFILKQRNATNNRNKRTKKSKDASYISRAWRSIFGRKK